MVSERESRIGLLGGSFDPVHLGHLMIAQDALEQLGLDQVVFFPASRNPFKPQGPVATNAQRLAMLEAALAEREAFCIDGCEIEGGGTSYTIDTALHLRERFPRARLLWILGADALGGLPRWKSAAQLVDLLEFAVLARPGCPLEVPELRGLRIHRVQGHQMDISSSEIRKRLANGLPVTYFLHPHTHDYLNKHGLYRATTTAACP